MPAAFGLEPLPGGGFVLPALSPRVGAELLHHGPMLVGVEQSCLEVAAPEAGTDELSLRAWTMQIVKGGRHAPFSVHADVLACSGDIVGCRAVMTDADDDPIAVAHLTYQR